MNISLEEEVVNAYNLKSAISELQFSHNKFARNPTEYAGQSNARDIQRIYDDKLEFVAIQQKIAQLQEKLKTSYNNIKAILTMVGVPVDRKVEINLINNSVLETWVDEQGAVNISDRISRLSY